MAKWKGVPVWAWLAGWSLLIHLPGLTSPLLDEQSYRQCQTALVSRFYARDGMKFLMPEVFRTGTPVRACTEFPIYSYLVACLYKVVGIHDWLGRLVSAIFGAWGAIFLYMFVRKRLGEESAIWSALVMCVIPVHLFHTRAFQPESMALWGLLGFMLYLDRWLNDGGHFRDALLAAGLGFIATSLKLPYVYLLVPLWAWLGMERRSWRALVSPTLVGVISLILGLTAAWYAYARTAPVHILPLGGRFHSENLRPLLTWSFYHAQFVSRLPEIYTTYAGMILGAAGGWALWRQSRLRFWGGWWLITAAYIMGIGNYGLFSRYAGLPFAPIHGVLIGAGITAWRARTQGNRWRRLGLALLIAAIPIHAVLRIGRWYRPENTFVFRARETMDRLARPGDLVLTQTALHPVFLYHLDRDGFALTMDEWPLSEVDRFRDLGARFFFTPIAGRWADHPDWAPYLMKRAKLVHKDPEFLIFEFL